jgi:hypothetical protein
MFSDILDEQEKPEQVPCEDEETDEVEDVDVREYNKIFIKRG